MLLSINPDNPQPRSIKQIAEKLRNGAVICYPTDTVYGIGCDIFIQKAIKRIFQIKKRPMHKPFSFMCSNLKNVSDYGHVSNMAYRIMRKALPGPFTFVLPAAKIVPKIMITKQKTVGIRIPDAGERDVGHIPFAHGIESCMLDGDFGVPSEVWAWGTTM